MSLLGLDINATRIRAVRGSLGDYPSTEQIDPPRAELPLVLNLEGRSPVLGGAGLRICRKSPHLVWQNLLPRLGEAAAKKGSGPICAKHPPGRSGKWGLTPFLPQGSMVRGLSKLDARKALSLAFQQVLAICREADGVVLALPTYLTVAQVDLALTAAEETRLGVLGSIASPLAAALAAHAEQAWFGSALVVDVDDNALTIATVDSDDGQARLIDVRSIPQLNERAWRERLLNALADFSILESRWDPRESPVSEQSLFDQLDEVLDAVQQGRIAKLTVQTTERYQNFVLQPHDTVAFCSNLRQRAVAELESIFTGPSSNGTPGAVLVTAAAARLPGLVAALQQRVPRWTSPPEPKKPSVTQLEDFGSGLLDDDPSESSAVVVLTPGAVAQGAHSVAGFFQRGDIARGHLDASAPLPLPQPLEAGPARLHFLGQDYLLGAGSFIIGRQSGADLVFDGDQWPNVSGRHCEIIYDHRTHMLCDRSREGTFVNGRPATQAMPLLPGDWIRLGMDGPLLRFLGQTVEMRTTA